MNAPFIEEQRETSKKGKPVQNGHSTEEMWISNVSCQVCQHLPCCKTGPLVKKRKNSTQPDSQSCYVISQLICIQTHWLWTENGRVKSTAGNSWHFAEEEWFSGQKFTEKYSGGTKRAKLLTTTSRQCRFQVHLGQMIWGPNKDGFPSFHFWLKKCDRMDGQTTPNLPFRYLDIRLNLKSLCWIFFAMFLEWK